MLIILALATLMLTINSANNGDVCLFQSDILIKIWNNIHNRRSKY